MKKYLLVVNAIEKSLTVLEHGEMSNFFTNKEHDISNGIYVDLHNDLDKLNVGEWCYDRGMGS